MIYFRDSKRHKNVNPFWMKVREHSESIEAPGLTQVFSGVFVFMAQFLDEIPLVDINHKDRRIHGISKKYRPS